MRAIIKRPTAKDICADKIELLTKADRQQLKAGGIKEEKVVAEIEIYKQGAPFLQLDRAALVGDGIKQIDDAAARDLERLFVDSAWSKEILKFVPASGAASRMFKELIQVNSELQSISLDEVVSRAAAGETSARQLYDFMLGIKKFAFFADLKAVMAEAGLEIDFLIGQGEFKEIIDYLLTAKGLNYAERPKGLLKFHQCREAGSRTAFEEHLVEAADYARGSSDAARLHFTVSPEHQTGFAQLVDEIKESCEKTYQVKFRITFSAQEKATDTIAVDLENRPFREVDGSLLFRPGGHGALLENLNCLSADIIFIKNIDNVVPDRLKGETCRWKKILGGQLLKVQKQIFLFLEKLSRRSLTKGLFDEILDFLQQELLLLPPADFDGRPDSAKCDFLIKILNRPLRVCGMVKNEGEPGGGPFWVKGKDGLLSLQIVEGAQIDIAKSDQLVILETATHFNPVDLVCGVRDWQNRDFDLKRYVDHDAVFIAQKSKDGRELKALELPGIWNGAMAYWNTIFVEVPLITFNPVKSINDLLREEHQN